MGFSLPQNLVVFDLVVGQTLWRFCPLICRKWQLESSSMPDEQVALVDSQSQISSRIVVLRIGFPSQVYIYPRIFSRYPLLPTPIQGICKLFRCPVLRLGSKLQPISASSVTVLTSEGQPPYGALLRLLGSVWR